MAPARAAPLVAAQVRLAAPAAAPPRVAPQLVAARIVTIDRELQHDLLETVGVLLVARVETTVTIGRLAARVRPVPVVRRVPRVPAARRVAIGSTPEVRVTVRDVPTVALAPTAPVARCVVRPPVAIGSSAAIAASVRRVATGPIVRIVRIVRPVVIDRAVIGRSGRSARRVTARRGIGTTATIVRLVQVAATVPNVVTARLEAVGAPAARRVVHLGPEKAAGPAGRCVRGGTRPGRRDRVAS